jgi:hypothetical protein
VNTTTTIDPPHAVSAVDRRGTIRRDEFGYAKVDYLIAAKIGDMLDRLLPMPPANQRMVLFTGRPEETMIYIVHPSQVTEKVIGGVVCATWMGLDGEVLSMPAERYIRHWDIDGNLSHAHMPCVSQRWIKAMSKLLRLYTFYTYRCTVDGCTATYKNGGFDPRIEAKAQLLALGIFHPPAYRGPEDGIKIMALKSKCETHYILYSQADFFADLVQMLEDATQDFVGERRVSVRNTGFVMIEETVRERVYALCVEKHVPKPTQSQVREILMAFVTDLKRREAQND